MEKPAIGMENQPDVMETELAVFARRKAELQAQIKAVGKTPVPDYNQVFNASGKLNAKLKDIIDTWHESNRGCFMVLQYRIYWVRDIDNWPPSIQEKRDMAYLMYDSDMKAAKTNMQAHYQTAMNEYQAVCAKFPGPDY